MAITCVTFNYDFLLERALEDAALISFDSLSAYVRPTTAVFKAHGSVDWVRAIDQGVLAGVAGDDTKSLIRSAATITWTDEYYKAGDPYHVRRGSDVYGPALAIPVESKAAYEMPMSHVEVMRERLSLTRHLLVIGWRTKDNEFVADLAERLPPNITVDIVTGSAPGGEAVEAELVKAGVTGTFRCHAGGFTQWIDQRTDEFISDLPRS